MLRKRHLPLHTFLTWAVFCLPLVVDANAQEQSSYRRLDPNHQQRLFDEYEGDESSTHSAVQVNWLGSLSDEAVDGKPTCATAWLQLPAASLTAELQSFTADNGAQISKLSISPLTAIAKGHTRATTTLGSSTFLVVYRLATEPLSVVDGFLHPLETMSCGIRNFHATSIGKMQSGWSDNDLEAMSEGASHLVFGIVSMGAGIESASALTSRLAPMTQHLGTQLQMLGAEAFSVGNTMVLRPAPVLVGAIPLTLHRVASVGAQSVAAGSSLVLYSVAASGTPANGELPSSNQYKERNLTITYDGEDGLQPLVDEQRISGFWVNDGKMELRIPGQDLHSTGLNKIRRGVTVIYPIDDFDLFLEVDQIFYNTKTGHIRVVMLDKMAATVLPAANASKYIMKFAPIS